MTAIRLLDGADVPAAKILLERVGLPGGAANIARYLRWQPDGAWGGFDGDALAGMVTLLRHGAAGFVGCMGVEPARQGRGLGRELLEHAHGEGRRAGVSTFLLEATPAGARLYRNLGYVDEHETAVLGRAAAGAADVAPIGHELAAICELDRAATASARDAMLAGLAGEFPGAVARTAGGLAGFGVVVGDRLGPLIARDPGAGRALVDRLAPGCANAALPLANEPALAALAAHGFTELRRLRRMRLGPALPSRTAWIWALASPGAG